MFERFTERARQIVVLAQDEARGFKHNYIGTEHILLGILREEEGLGARTLQAFELTVDDVRRDIERMVGYGSEALTGQIPFTPRAKKVLEFALREALSIGHNYIGTEHVLLGLIREEEGIAGRILSERHISIEMIRTEVIRTLSKRYVDPSEMAPKLDVAISAARICALLAQFRVETLGGQRTVENLGAQVLAEDGLNPEKFRAIADDLREIRIFLKRQQAA